MDSNRPKQERLEETLEGGREPPRAVAPLEEEEESFVKNFLCNRNCVYEDISLKQT